VIVTDGSKDDALPSTGTGMLVFERVQVGRAVKRGSGF